MIIITAKKTLTALALLSTLSTSVIGSQTDQTPSDSPPTQTNSEVSVIATQPDNSELEALRLELEKIKAEKEQLLQAQEGNEAELKELRERSSHLEQESQRAQKEIEETGTSLDKLKLEVQAEREHVARENGNLQTDLEKLREELKISSKEKEEQLTQLRSELEETQLTSIKEREESLKLKNFLEGELEKTRMTLSFYQEAFTPQIDDLLKRVRDLNPDPFKVETLVTNYKQAGTLSQEAAALLETLRQMSEKYEKSISDLSPVFPNLAQHQYGTGEAIILYLRAAQDTLEKDTDRLIHSVRELRRLHRITKVTPSDHTTTFLIALSGLDAVLHPELQLSESQAKAQIETFLQMIGYLK